MATLLYQGQPGNTSAAVFTATSETMIYAASVCNPTGGAVTLDVWLVPSGGSAVDATMVYKANSVAAGSQQSLAYLINQALAAGDAIHMAASAATSLTVTMSGREV